MKDKEQKQKVNITKSVKNFFKKIDDFFYSMAKKTRSFVFYYLAVAVVFESAFRLDSRDSTKELMQEMNYQARGAVYLFIALSLFVLVRAVMLAVNLWKSKRK